MESKQTNKLIDTKSRLAIVRNRIAKVAEMDESDQKAKTGSDKINESWRCNLQQAVSFSGLLLVTREILHMAESPPGCALK